MVIIEFEKSKMKKEFVESFYYIYKVDYASNLYDTLKWYLSVLKRTKRVDMAKFEADLGIVEYCLDFDLYYRNDCYYLILVLRDADSFEKNKLNGLVRITPLQLKKELGNKFERFEGFGTGNLLEKLCLS